MINIHPMQPSDAKAVAKIHSDGIPQGFLSKLGLGFRATMYNGIATAPTSGVWVAVNEFHEVIGFISGTLHVGRCYRSVLLRKSIPMGIHALPSLLAPKTWRHAFETLTYPNHKTERTDNPDLEPSAELLSMAVTPKARGTGAAKRLCQVLEENLLDFGINGPYRVVTMAADPRSNAFYRKVGFQFIREFSHHGIAMNLYHKDLSR